jgi:eukaryotic-like serine/threonine-protein kinase
MKNNLLLLESELKSFEILESNYNVIENVARGGFSLIFKVEKKKQFYAAKIFLDEVKRQFPHGLVQEAKRTEKVSMHPNIVTFHDLLDDEVLLTKWEDGHNLSHFISRHYRFSHDEIRKTKNELLDALKYAHAKKVIHRDISLKNIIYNSSTILHDWGLTDEMENGLGHGVVMGSKGYIAKEVILGSKTSPSSDYFSLGIVLKCLTEQKFPSGEMMPKSNEQVISDLRKLNLPLDLELSIKYLTSNTVSERNKGTKEYLLGKLISIY